MRPSEKALRCAQWRSSKAANCLFARLSPNLQLQTFRNLSKRLVAADQSCLHRLRVGEIATSTEIGLVGCTQVTEILYTAGVQLVAVLPKEFELATVYTAAVCTKAAQPQVTAALIKLLISPDAAELRRLGGFE